jgi:aldose sugar dehydrogenase
MHALRLLLAYLAATLACAALGSVIQTQFNLAAIAALGAEIPFGLRLSTTALDLAGFAPLWAGILALGFLIAFVVALLIHGFLRRHRSALLIAAGTVSVFTTLWAMQAMLPITVIAATRGGAGFVALGLTGAVAGWVFDRLSRPRIRQP